MRNREPPVRSISNLGLLSAPNRTNTVPSGFIPTDNPNASISISERGDFASRNVTSGCPEEFLIKEMLRLDLPDVTVSPFAPSVTSVIFTAFESITSKQGNF